MTSLTFPMKATAALSRRLPVQVRRVRMWRDQLYRAIGAGGWDEDDEIDAKWPALQPPVRGRASGLRMALDLTDWMERRSYFTGRFYQEDLEDLLSTILRAGDNFVDVGANIGLVTLHAASLVGKTGAVRSFEPNPKTFARLAHNIEINGLRQCRASNCGLGTEDQSLRLNLFGRHSGRATLLGDSKDAVETVPVEIARGEDQLADLDTSKPTLVKIDVEGYEVSVLKGLGKFLNREVAVVAEVSPTWLEKAGSSTNELLDLLAYHGLMPHKFEHREGRYSRQIVVTPMNGQRPQGQYDCLFVRPRSVFADRFAGSLALTDRGRNSARLRLWPISDYE